MCLLMSYLINVDRMSVNATPTFMPTALENVSGFISTLQSTRKPENTVPKEHITHVSSNIKVDFSYSFVLKRQQ